MTPLWAVSIYWDLPVLLIVFSLVYSATRHDHWDRILREALGWGLRIGGFLLMVGVVLYVASSMPDRWPYLLAVLGVLMLAYFFIPMYLHRKSHANTPPNPNVK